jgi:hypothetical protein
MFFPFRGQRKKLCNPVYMAQVNTEPLKDWVDIVSGHGKGGVVHYLPNDGRIGYNPPLQFA